MKIRKATSEGVTRWNVFDEDGKRVGHYDSEADALVATGICPVRVYSSSRDWTGHTCRREIKTEGATKCNLHLAADKRRQANDEARREQYAREDQVRKSVAAKRESATERLVRLFGEDAQYDLGVDYGRGHSFAPTGKFVISASLLSKLLDAAESAS